MCTGCHEPHAGKNRKLLVSGDLCFNCHDRGMFSGKKLVHAPVAAGMCASCHDPHSSPAPKMLSPDIPKLCTQCHNKEEFLKRDTHGPVYIGMCMFCHEPHQSDEAKLLAEKVPDLCFECHRRSKFAKKNVHPPVAEGKCLTCHEPHSAKYRHVLRADGNEVCRECHPGPFEEAHAVTGLTSRGHKISGKRDPIRKNNPFGCSSCHNPHSSDSIRLFRFEAVQSHDICINCHEK